MHSGIYHNDPREILFLDRDRDAIPARIEHPLPPCFEVSPQVDIRPLRDFTTNFLFSPQLPRIIQPRGVPARCFFFGGVQGLGTGPCLPYRESRDC